LWCYKEKNDQNASLDYCTKQEYDYQSVIGGCKCLRFPEIEQNIWRDYGYVDTSKGEWVFDLKKISDQLEGGIQRLKYCPLLNPKKVRDVLKNIPERINPQKEKGWAFLTNDFKEWFWNKDSWISTYGDTAFPGLNMAIGIKKIKRDEINEAIRYSKPVMMDIETPGVKRPKTTQKKKGCFIATAVYGHSEEYQVRVLKNFRDSRLEGHVWGEILLDIYYHASPFIAESISHSVFFTHIIRRLINIIVKYIEDRYYGLNL